MIRFAFAEPTDAYELVLREEDLREVSAGWRQNVALACLDFQVQSARDSQGRLVALYGLQLQDGQATPWLLCSTLVEHHGATAWRTARRFMRHLAFPAVRAGYRVANLIPRTSISNRRFVQALGFCISPTADPAWDVFYLDPHV